MVKHSNTMVSTLVTSTFDTVGRCQIELERKISISVKRLMERDRHPIKAEWMAACALATHRCGRLYKWPSSTHSCLVCSAHHQCCWFTNLQNTTSLNTSNCVRPCTNVSHFDVHPTSATDNHLFTLLMNHPLQLHVDCFFATVVYTKMTSSSVLNDV